MITKERMEEMVKDVLAMKKEHHVPELVRLLNSLHSQGMMDAGLVGHQYMEKRNFLLRDEVYGVILDAIRGKPPV
jgi:hypothetical protein